jgi:carbamoyltransferase
MILIGFNGSFEMPFCNSSDLGIYSCHDSAAILVKDGQIEHAIEEERLNRIKHTNKFPILSINALLRQAGISLKDIDCLCYAFSDEGQSNIEAYKQSLYLHKEYSDCRSKIASNLTKNQPKILEQLKERIYFVPHHLSHAASSFYFSGFDSCLIAVFDGNGDGLSGLIISCDNGKFKIHKKLAEAASIGHFYANLILPLGYCRFDEYKVMGLAPYGDPDIYKNVFSNFYTLLPNGEYTINYDEVVKANSLMPIRKRGQEFQQSHKDWAASLQQATEDIVMHVLKHFREDLGYRNLCLAGGVAQNCTLNGKVAYSKLFDNVYVPAASHDAGAALGSALYMYYEKETNKKHHRKVSFTPYIGSDLGHEDSVINEISSWTKFIYYEKSNNICIDAAKLLAQGKAVGWVQGRSEFGPRALGNRSILADPRPEKNKNIINAIIKKREAYRPFAPSILLEYVADFFEIPNGMHEFPFMTIILNVKDQWRKILGAVTHVDGTARLQTVSKEANEKYWGLIEEFRKITGIPILLNTSFNNNYEPIVDSIYDAIVCFLTTGLEFLIVGDVIIYKRVNFIEDILCLSPVLPIYSELTSMKSHSDFEKVETIYKISSNFCTFKEQRISFELFQILNGANRNLSIESLQRELGMNIENNSKIKSEILSLWEKRLIGMTPVNLTKGN